MLLLSIAMYRGWTTLLFRVALLLGAFLIADPSLLGDCAIAMPASLAKRSPWESTAGKTGVCLADVEELSLCTGSTCKGFKCVPVDQLHESSSGFAFMTFQRLQDWCMFRTSGPFAAILKGFICDKVVTLGFESNRVSEVVVTIWDAIAHSTESRAVTLVNLSLDESDWICPTHSDTALDLESDPKIVLLVELRKTDAALSDWQAFGNREAFDSYIESLVTASGIRDRSVLHRTNAKDGYLAKRIQIPKTSRNYVYKKSGQNSIQLRAARSTGDPQEENIEILRIFGEANLADYSKVAESHEFSYGVFASQGAVYTRVCSEKLAEARKFWFPQDERFDAGNLGVKCKLHYRVQGLPAGTTLGAVRDVLREIGWEVVPLRVWHLAELASAIVACETEPKQTKVFTNLGSLLISREEKPMMKRKDTTRVVLSQAVPASQATPSSSLPSSVASVTGVRPYAGQSLLPPPPPNPELLARVEMLEKQMGETTSTIKVVQSEQADMKQQIHSGFRDMMQALQEMKDMQAAAASTTSSPLKSPPPKVQKK